MRGRKLPQSSLRDASPLGDGAFGMAGRFLIAIDTLATELTACALSVKAYGFASSPKGRALGMAGKFLAEVQSFRERLLPRGELSRSD